MLRTERRVRTADSKPSATSGSLSVALASPASGDETRPPVTAAGDLA
ncbi:hypothetical protein [Natrinema sp. CBA1119]|nr:hypothetical protein [Natrinema sp. CBA1119]